MAFHKIYLVTFTRKKIHQWAPQESKVSSWYFKKVDSSGYIIYYISLESIFFPDFKKGIWNPNYLILSNYLSRIDIIDLASSKATHVYEIMICFTNYDVINLYMTSRHMFWFQNFVSEYTIIAPRLIIIVSLVKKLLNREGRNPPPLVSRSQRKSRLKNFWKKMKVLYAIVQEHNYCVSPLWRLKRLIFLD